MAKCSNCSCEYDEDDISLLHADVSKLSQNLCQDCLEDLYDIGETGIFKDTCERCGKEFDVMKEKDVYNSSRSSELADFDSFDEILCADCASLEAERINKELDDEDDLGFEEEDDAYDEDED